MRSSNPTATIQSLMKQFRWSLLSLSSLIARPNNRHKIQFNNYPPFLQSKLIISIIQFNSACQKLQVAKKHQSRNPSQMNQITHFVLLISPSRANWGVEKMGGRVAIAGTLGMILVMESGVAEEAPSGPPSIPWGWWPSMLVWFCMRPAVVWWPRRPAACGSRPCALLAVSMWLCAAVIGVWVIRVPVCGFRIIIWGPSCGATEW